MIYFGDNPEACDHRHSAFSPSGLPYPECPQIQTAIAGVRPAYARVTTRLPAPITSRCAYSIGNACLAMSLMA
jgi:hypothetical protein